MPRRSDITRFALALVLVFGLAAPLAADDWDDANAAYDRGDFSSAVSLLQPLAEAGDARAQQKLGSLYYYGKGVSQDYAEALKWARLAAEQEYAKGQYSLGYMYATGKGVPQDFVEATKWFRLAAEQRYDRAQSILGFMHETGSGVSQDYTEALKWYMCFTDPPYNVNYANSAKDKLRGKNRPILNDALGDGFGAMLYDASVNILTVTKGAVYICMSSSELDTLKKAFREAGGKWSTFVIWAKNTFTLGRSDYQRQYEPILYGWKDGADHYWCGARDQGDVWFFDKPARNDLHPTMKPVALVERAIRNSSKSRDIVLDPFGGSGTTIIAAARSGRRARVIELDPRYCDVIVERWQGLNGKVAELKGDAHRFPERHHQAYAATASRIESDDRVETTRFSRSPARA